MSNWTKWRRLAPDALTRSTRRHRRNAGLIVAMAAAIFITSPPAAAPGHAQTPAPTGGSKEQEPPPRLRERDVFEATLASRAGLKYRILVSAPRGHAPDAGFPILYVLDGDAFFNTAVEIARMREWGRLTPTIVVGVAYPGRAFYDGARRNHDFTPPGSADPDFDPGELGGADSFLEFLDGSVQPWVRERYSVDASRRVLFGHSLGGMFVLHAMFKSPRSFDVYLAASPTLRFSSSFILREARAFETHPERHGVRAMITVGGLESSPPPEQVDDHRRYFTANPDATGGVEVEEALRQMFPVTPGFDKARETRRMAQRLSRSGVHATFVEFAGDEHLPAGVSALNRGLAFALRPEMP
jgi:predicted alpha/beta superfamily hydrolase